MSDIESPNFTQVPNALLGNIARGNKVEPGLMTKLQGSELKVYLAVCRMTFGYHQSERRASLQMMMDLTGLSKPAVHSAAKRLQEMGLIELNQDGGVTLWKAAVNLFNQDYGKAVVNLDDQPVKLFNPPGKISLPPSKKETKNKPKKETNIAANAALLPDTPHSRLFFKKLATEFEAKGRRPPEKFPSLACKRKFDARAAYLNGNTGVAIERALQKGILGVTEITDFIAKYDPSKQTGATNYGTYQRNNQRINQQPTGHKLKSEPTYNKETDELVYPDGTRVPAK